jgi:DNA-binding NarL/FixJ family response regulator
LRLIACRIHRDKNQTVEVNLSRIYRKLKIRSRMELYRAWDSGTSPD